MNFQVSPQDLLSADLTMGTVMLKVGDMKIMTNYYQQALGLDPVAERTAGSTWAAAPRRWSTWPRPPGCSCPSRGEAGLFHTALLFENQSALAATVASAAQYDPQSFTGSADHLVSEAFYFTDPEGNGIELYWDRPRDRGPGTRPPRAGSRTWTAWPCPRSRTCRAPDRGVGGGQRQAGAGVGHVHLQVGDVQSRRGVLRGHASASRRRPAGTARRCSSPPAATTTTWP